MAATCGMAGTVHRSDQSPSAQPPPPPSTQQQQQQQEQSDASAPAYVPPVPELLRRFLRCQERRALQYAALDRAFRLFLASKQEFVFQQAVQQATQAFNDCSRQVIAAELCLKQDHERADLAALLRTVQENEREKLRLTLSLQSLKQAYAFESLAFQHQGGEEEEDLLEPPAPRTCGCGHGAAHGHPHDHQEGQVAPQPARAEYKAAMREAQLLLDVCVRTINDAIDEAREVLLEEEQG